MVSGPLRTVLWVLGALGVLWVLVWLVSIPTMGGMMGGGPGEGGMMGGEGAMTGGRMLPMSGLMVTQTLGMLGLAGIFAYLVVDTLRGRRDGRRDPEEGSVR